jgi:hypothetical protein
MPFANNADCIFNFDLNIFSTQNSQTLISSDKILEIMMSILGIYRMYFKF